MKTEPNRYLTNKKLTNKIPVLVNYLQEITKKHIADIAVSESEYYNSNKMLCFKFYKQIF